LTLDPSPAGRITILNDWQLQRIAPGHCTGEPAFSARTADIAGERYVFCGLGDSVSLI
jgi:7,8-dihydropterin-6-yl-methyl-4-(beta-D-ribofuranosyl)aminobenzene 5'-phosphate synthase